MALCAGSHAKRTSGEILAGVVAHIFEQLAVTDTPHCRPEGQVDVAPTAELESGVVRLSGTDLEPSVWIFCLAINNKVVYDLLSEETKPKICVLADGFCVMNQHKVAVKSAEEAVKLATVGQGVDEALEFVIVIKTLVGSGNRLRSSRWSISPTTPIPSWHLECFKGNMLYGFRNCGLTMLKSFLMALETSFIVTLADPLIRL
jgi:hypothetical protein